MASSRHELLSPSLKTKAKRELREQPEHIDAHVESFRRWITSLPHITFPCEHHLLIPFLRYAKYNHAKAQQRLDNFCTIRASKELGAPRWFDFPPLTDPLLDDYLKSGVVLNLGRTTEDLSVILIRLGNWNMDVVNPSSLRCFSYMDVDRFLLDPASQIAGFIFFFDLTGVGKKHFVLRSNQKEVRLESKVWRDAYPIRVRHVIYFNEPKIMDIIFKLVEIWMSSKVRERVSETFSRWWFSAVAIFRGLNFDVALYYFGRDVSKAVLLKVHCIVSPFVEALCHN
ncbi:Retinol-binding protein pinta [Clonorchis sinensis]|uniref:Alpha-tocopherol transfer protein-like n=2 Tax=Clonorchis sinensis TaxID=79923 RepID=H2KRK8_CLOSI|nr:Retinol-binding protein pinta [Clonorchis sinensis]GAA42037.2 alpha-tocopherol transfer protein-like [Clonorchis sinensis]